MFHFWYPRHKILKDHCDYCGPQAYLSQKLQFSCSLSHSIYILNFVPLAMEQVRSEYRKYNKTKAFCWAINNCNNGWTPRVTLGLEIIRKLPEKIHMFGSAASNCFKTAAEFIENHGSFGGSANPDTSRQAHMRDCKFYFSFENSNCSG